MGVALVVFSGFDLSEPWQWKNTMQRKIRVE